MLGILRQLYGLLTGFYLVEQRIKSIEDHILIINDEMGAVGIGQATLLGRVDKLGEDLAYIRGRLDK